ncbi:MAG: hypothetical protein AAF826_12660 [Pseudomonadota bacterium]
MTIVFQHLRNTQNIGDRWCSPYDYFDWENAEAKDLRVPSNTAYDVGIYGGGKIFGTLADQVGIVKNSGTYHIAWGVSTVQSMPFSPKYNRSKRICHLVGSRDWGDQRFDYAPCVSCMSPLFDNPSAPQHDVVFYAHGGKTKQQKIEIPDHIPTNTNNCDTLEDAISFIASGATVISNSYHGVYWALLLGRKTICIPFSNKFSKYRKSPHYAKPKTWLNDLDKGKAYPDMLDISREATLKFKSKVDDVLNT